MDKRKQLRSLAEIAKLRRDIENGKLASLRGREELINRRFGYIDALGAENHSESSISPFGISGRESIWTVWRQRATHDLNLELAKLKADIEVQKKHTSRAVARFNVIDKLSKKP